MDNNHNLQGVVLYIYRIWTWPSVYQQMSWYLLVPDHQQAHFCLQSFLKVSLVAHDFEYILFGQAVFANAADDILQNLTKTSWINNLMAPHATWFLYVGMSCLFSALLWYSHADAMWGIHTLGSTDGNCVVCIHNIWEMRTGPWFNITRYCQYRKSYCQDNAVVG